MPLPDCPACDAASTLEVERVEDARGVRVCWCTCCGKRCRVNAVDKVVYCNDVNGVPMEGGELGP